MLPQLVAFLTASILLTLSPGPDIIYVLVQSIANGRKAGILTAFGLVSGIVVHTSLVAFGVSAVINESEILFRIIKILGALYLFYLAFKVWKGPAEISVDTPAPLKRNFALFKHGFVMNVLNPKVTIFFLAFFPGFLWEPSKNTIFQFFILGMLFMIQAFIIFSLIALLAGRISNYLRKHSSSGIILKWVQIVVFVGIGVLILL